MRPARIAATLSTIGILLSTQSTALAQAYYNDPTYDDRPTYYPPRYAVPYRGGGVMTRGEFVQMLSTSFGIPSGDTHCFRDVGSESRAPAICGAKAQGIVTETSTGYFRPNASINLVEAGAMVVRAQNIFLPNDNPWYRPYLRQLSAWDAVPESVQSILDPLSRVQASELISLAQFRGGIRNYNDDYYVAWDDVKVVVTGPTGRVRTGDTVSYKIAVHSLRQYSLTHVQAFLDPDMSFVSATRDGQLRDPDRVVWDDVGIRGDGKDTLTLRVRIDGNVRSHDAVKLRVQAGNGSDSVVTRIYEYDCSAYDRYGNCINYPVYDCRYTGDLRCDPYYDRY